ncbi:ureidoglycolate lyase [Roseomonas populi]|uniref:Ureidoglycolate lyase n=1 Tax=Roseomonas populi TaxID=3121582 RepID=A0ABT1X3C1_9PROT|nr:ureidoglycolate lyase [Roseomonas pecuniae]MCR0982600.1 ureidoglycolate lyase [Roseomonas pecuniae]
MISVQPLTEDAFAAYGEVLTVPVSNGRRSYERALLSTRPEAKPVLTFSQRDPLALPLRVRQMERHVFSSQSFIPLAPARFLVLVAPHAPQGGPDMTRAEAFLAGFGQGITYGANVWHHGMTVLDAPARFAVLIWQAGTAEDEEFVDVAPFDLDLPQELR